MREKGQTRKRRHPGWQLLLGLILCAGLILGGLTTAWGAERDNSPKMVLPVGQAVGIRLFSRGVLVVGLSQVETAEGTVMPARACGLRTGDIITEIDAQPVESIDQVAALIQSLQGEEMSLQVQRGSRTVALSGEAVQCVADGSYKFGAWLRDSMAGIGTVTWYDPDTRTFAALGHGITDVDTGLLMPIRRGSILPATITGVQRGEKGAPGQLHGSFDLTQEIGTLTVNSEWGIFGQAEEPPWTGELVPVATRSQVKVGAAEVLANLTGDQVERFQVEIERIYPTALGAGRDLMVRITDPSLLQRTGGIVQGLSGAPILQDSRLVGAVTHVLVNDPTRGYGILAETMLGA